jgi:hypothetical protein
VLRSLCSDCNADWTVRVSNSARGKGYFSSLKLTHCLWAPPSLFFEEYRVLSTRVQRPWREVNHSSPYSADITNEWSYTHTPPIAVGKERCLHFTLLTVVIIKEFRFAVTAAVDLNSSVFWVVTRREVVSNRRFGTAYVSHL